MRILVLLLALSIGCKTRPVASSVDAGCPAGASPVACPGGPLLYCCPPDAFCAPPSCVDADAPTPLDLAQCPPGQVLLIPCCGGFNDTACSNSAGPPAPPPFCTDLPSFCEGQTSCAIGGCNGALDENKRTLGCLCI